MGQDLLNRINSTNKDYFERNPVVRTMPAKNLMPEFIKARIFAKDYRDGLPIRNVLRALDRPHYFDADSICPGRTETNQYLLVF